ncbi:hypothetical protein [Lapidilactobacillus wuchangensis]|uniref:hypothetical protein n=1 Tax=Lapidilactobacillus wuchangensis TaxID=2486001 RepID=UPI000F7847CA|nr:hypothetical protein [Lapidilactobacillus wuchangensis]
MSAYLKFHWQLLRRRWPWAGLIILILGVMWGGLLHEQQQQTRYVTAYREYLKASAKRWANRPDDAGTYGSAKFQLASLKDPAEYAQNYAQSLPKYISRQRSGRQIYPDVFYHVMVFDSNGKDPFHNNETKATIQELKIVTQQKLVTLFPTRMLTNEKTATSYSGSEEEYQNFFQRSSQRFYTTGWYFLEHYLRQPLVLVLIISCLMMLIFDWPQSLSKQESQSHWLRLTQVSWRRQYYTNFINKAIGSLLILLSILGIFLLGSRLIAEWGSLQYPIFIWQGLKKFAFKPLWQVLLLKIGLCYLLLLFAFACYQLLAVMTRSTVLTTFSAAFICLLSLLVPPVWWSPLSYFDVQRTVDHFRYLEMGAGNWWLTIIVLLVWTGLLLFSGDLIYQLHERRNGQQMYLGSHKLKGMRA